MKTYIIIGFIFLILVSFSFGYEVNETIIINAEYRDMGILTASTAQITIINPAGNIVVSNDNMNVQSTGVFNYTYIVPRIEGEYRAVARFFVGGVYKGSDSQTFNVGNVNKLNIGSCPTGATGNTILIVVLILTLICGFIGILTNIIGLTLFSSIMMLFLSITTWDCGQLFGLFTAVGGAIMLIIAGFQKY